MNPQKRLRSNSLRIAVALLAMAGTACVEPEPPGLRVGKGQTDVVFGVKEVASTPGKINEAAAEDYLVGDFELTDEGLPVPPRRPLPLSTAVSTCPTAKDGAPVEKPVTANVEGKPAEGRYRWRRSGTVTGDDGRNHLLQGFERRAVQVTASTDVGFDYQVLQEDPRSLLLMRTTYRVKHTTERVYGVVVTANADGVVEPAGVRLVSVEYLDPETGEPIGRRTFRPSPPILLVAAPILPGGKPVTTSADPNYGVVDVAGEVVGRATVDACGDLVEGWHVKSRWTQRGEGIERTWTYDYVIATQLGGMLIGEHRVEEGSAAQKADYSLAQLRPDRLK